MIPDNRPPQERHARQPLVRALTFLTPILVCILVMLPRLISPQFGLFDDGKSILTARQVIQGDWGFHFDTGDGRFRPIYWLSFALVYQLFGLQPVWYFLANAIVLVVTTYCLIQLLINMGKGSFQAWITGMFFALASPVIENFYTLSKGEPWQLMFLALGLLVVSRYHRRQRWVTKAGLIFLVTFLQLLANFAKETSVIILPVALAWYLVIRFSVRKESDRSGLAPYGAYLVASCVSVAAYLLLRFTFISGALQTQGYSSRYVFTLAQILAASIRWTGWLVRDFSYLLPLGIAAAVLWISKKRLQQASLVLNAFIWVAAWIAVFIPWYFMAEYYMLPAAFGLVLLGGSFISTLISALRQGEAWKKWVSGLAMGISALLFLSSLLGSLASARIQLSVDAANTAMMTYLAKNAPAGSSLFVNIQTTNEYVDQIAMQLPAVYHRPDLSVKVFRPPDLSTSGTYYIVEPLVSHQPLLTVRMGVVEPTQDAWNQDLQAYLASHPGWQRVAEFNRQFRLSIVDLPRLLCPLVKTRSFCATPSPLIDRRLFAYGWKIYRWEVP